MSFSKLYTGKVGLYRMPNAWSIMVVDDTDPRYNAESPNLFDNSTAIDCFKFMVGKAKEFGNNCKVDAYIPDLSDKLGRKQNRFTVEELAGFDFTEYTMAFKTNKFGTQLMITKPQVKDKGNVGLTL